MLCEIGHAIVSAVNAEELCRRSFGPLLSSLHRYFGGESVMDVASGASAVVAVATSQTDYGSIGTLLAAVVSAIAAVGAWIWTRNAALLSLRYQESSAYLEECKLALRRAHGALTEGQDVSPIPLPDRLNWLTAARHIQSYKKLKIRVNEKAHREVLESHEEEWRHRFYVSLGRNSSIFPSGYYSQSAVPEGRRSPIEPRSALIVHDFANWPEGKEDPLNEADIEGILGSFKVFMGQPGLEMYISEWQGKERARAAKN